MRIRRIAVRRRKKFAVLGAAVLVAIVAASGNGGTTAQAATKTVKCGSGPTAQRVHSSVTAPIPLQASWNFTAACVQHDKCYAHFGSSKLKCDEAFLANMFSECKAHYRGATLHRCENVALLYHADYINGGELQYQNAQKKGALELFSGSYTGSGSVTATETDPYGPPTTVTTPWGNGDGTLTVTDGKDGGVPLIVDITWQEDVETVTATATYGASADGITVSVTDDFTYDPGSSDNAYTGSETVKSTLSGSGTPEGCSCIVVVSGSFSGTKQTGG